MQALPTPGLAVFTCACACNWQAGTLPHHLGARTAQGKLEGTSSILHDSHQAY